MTGRKPYSPGRRIYAPLPGHLAAGWSAVAPSSDRDVRYRPCSATLKDGTVLPCVYVIDAQSYIDAWGVWPEDDEGKRHISIGDVAELSDSPLRMPARFADQLYRAGESGMGYFIFAVEFSDGSRQVCVSGNAVDFVRLPPGKTTRDIVSVVPHAGRGEHQVDPPDYYWCLFGQGESTRTLESFA